MEFVKASERLPKYDDPLHAKIDGIRRMGNFFDSDTGEHSFYVQGNGASPSWIIPESKFSGLQWLDEQSSPDGWVSSDIQPVKPGVESYEQIPCIVSKNGEQRILQWNCEHLCWDGEDGDDYECDLKDVDFYYPLSQLPPLPKKDKP